jgi:hypothetical protein
MPDPVAFMVMPFDRKKTERTDQGVPSEVDFDALWGQVYHPVLQRMGYQPVRADGDTGAMIILEMIQRLAVADLVVADVTLPNANVYYEVGIRHAAQRKGSILVAADWAKPVFDLQQMRQLRFPLADGEVGRPAAKAARAKLRAGLPALVDGTSPVFDAIPGFPQPDPVRLSAFRDTIDDLAAFDAAVKAARLAPAGERRAKAMEVHARFGSRKVVREAVVLALIRLLRDLVDWPNTLRYIESLPDRIASHPLVVEQRCLALSNTGEPVAAAAQLETLIATEGGTSERYGLLGGRYKALVRSTEHPRDRTRYLNLAIQSYERGMQIDLNDYYPSSNLARLYRQRGAPGDEESAMQALVVTAAACKRAIALGSADEWVRPTLLGSAFDRGDAAEAETLLDQIEREGADGWKLDTTVNDLGPAAARPPDAAVRERLERVVGRLRELRGGT